jgi:hypothetical protein
VPVPSSVKNKRIWFLEFRSSSTRTGSYSYVTREGRRSLVPDIFFPFFESKTFQQAI